MKEEQNAPQQTRNNERDMTRAELKEALETVFDFTDADERGDSVELNISEIAKILYFNNPGVIGLRRAEKLMPSVLSDMKYHKTDDPIIGTIKVNGSGHVYALPKLLNTI